MKDICMNQRDVSNTLLNEFAGDAASQYGENGIPDMKMKGIVLLESFNLTKRVKR